MLSDKRSDSKQWFGSQPKKADTERERANPMHALEKTNKKNENFL
jgi:hypothetical protein